MFKKKHKISFNLELLSKKKTFGKNHGIIAFFKPFKVKFQPISNIDYLDQINPFSSFSKRGQMNHIFNQFATPKNQLLFSPDLKMKTKICIRMKSMSYQRLS